MWSYVLLNFVVEVNSEIYKYILILSKCETGGELIN